MTNQSQPWVPQTRFGAHIYLIAWAGAAVLGIYSVLTTGRRAPVKRVKRFLKLFKKPKERSSGRGRHKNKYASYELVTLPAEPKPPRKRKKTVPITEPDAIAVVAQEPISPNSKLRTSRWF